MSVKSKSHGLGRGFDSLIPSNFDTTLLVDAADRIQNVSISDIAASPDQPRRHFDEAALNELAASIKRYGVIQPIIVSPQANNKFIIVAGERRWRAAQIAGLTHIPTIVRKREELEQLEVALIENVQRVDLSPIEQAVSIERLHQQFNLSYTEIAKKLAKAETTISNIVRLLHLPSDARNALQNGTISEGHARAILALKDSPEKQSELLQLITSNQWSVRQAEQFVTAHKAGLKNTAAIQKKMSSETPLTKRISKELNAPVKLRQTAKGGRIEIGYKDDNDLERLLKLLA